MTTGPGRCPVSVEGSVSDAVVGTRAETTPGPGSGPDGDRLDAMAAKVNLLAWPAGERQAFLEAARRRALQRLKARHAEEYQSLYDDELAHPPAIGATS